MTGKADRVLQLVKDPDIKEAFSTVREFYRDMIEETPISEDDALLDIRKMLKLLRDVEDHLQTVIDNGILEDFRAAEDERRS